MFDHISLNFNSESKTVSRLDPNKVKRWVNLYPPDDYNKKNNWYCHYDKASADSRAGSGSNRIGCIEVEFNKNDLKGLL